MVGAGLAGLSCARNLYKADIPFVLLEKSEHVGGRVWTDRVKGFLLDRGFQVVMTAYPELEQQLDLVGLDLGHFYPGAFVRYRGKMRTVADPFRRFNAVFPTLFAPVGSLFDKMRVGRMRWRLNSLSLEQIWREPEMTAIEALRTRYGFSERILQRFLRPFLGGALGDPELTQSSSRMLEFIFRCFAHGEIGLPAQGMASLPRQLASQLPNGSIHFRANVVELGERWVRLENGTTINGSAVVVATDGPTAAHLVSDESLLAPVEMLGHSCVYFSAEHPPLTEPIVVLNGEGERDGPVNMLCVPSQVQPSYAPKERSLVACVTLGIPELEEEPLVRAVREQMTRWFGTRVESWEHLRSYRISHALPKLPSMEPPQRPVQLRPGLFACGDHRDNGSIDGALASGRRCAEAVQQELQE